jgi:hypothetical protein
MPLAALIQPYALWEYDNIIRSLYLLDYIDSPPLRRNVQWALNRGESYHQLRRAVSYANFGKWVFLHNAPKGYSSVEFAIHIQKRTPANSADLCP